MRFYLDTEFYEDGKRIYPISIGLVSEDGREFYAEFEEALPVIDSLPGDHWLMTNVVSLLAPDRFARSTASIAAHVAGFVHSGMAIDLRRPEFWAYYSHYDWVLMCQLFGDMKQLPAHWPMMCMDLEQLRRHAGVEYLPKQASTEHHALADARWSKGVHEYLMDAILFHETQELDVIAHDSRR